MKPLRDISTNFEQQGHRTLLATLMLIILANPFFLHFGRLRWLLTLFFMLTLLAAVRIVVRRARHYQFALILGVVALVFQLGVFVDRAWWIEAIRYIATMLFLFWVSGFLLRDIILRSHEASGDLIFGAINIYLMVGLAFAFVYGLTEHLLPGSFTGLEEQLAAPGYIGHFVYFSFITLTTLGYGDITPLTPIGTTVSYVEAIFGQMYIAILVARLVGIYISQPKPPA